MREKVCKPNNFRNTSGSVVMRIKMMIIKVVLVDDDDNANIESAFLTPEHIIYVY